MGIASRFFGKDCLIDRALQNRANLELKLLEENISATHILMLNQIHSNQVIVVDSAEKIYDSKNQPKADSLVTNLPNIALAIVTADCAPILFYDEKKRVIAAAHAGWRGAKSGVIKETILAMKNLGAKNITAQIGPMIQKNSYEISQEFFDDFLKEDQKNEIFFLATKPDKYLFDLPSYIKNKIEKESVKIVKDLEIDTYENGEDFFSFRRSTHLNEKDCGRNVSIIAISD